MPPNSICSFARILPRFSKAIRSFHVILPVVLCLAAGVVGSLAEEKPEKGEMIELTAGRETQRSIAAGDKNTFEIALHRRQVLRLSIEKGDLALSLTIYGPTGQKMLDEVSTRYEYVDVLLPADAEGKYRLDVRSLETAGIARRYDLRVNPLTITTTEELRVYEAYQSFARATLLRTDWNEKSLRQAIEESDRAETTLLFGRDFHMAAIAANLAGETCIAIGEYREALKRYQMEAEAAKRGDDRLGQAQAHGQIGLLLSYLGKNKEARNHLITALGLLDLPSTEQSETSKRAYAVVLSNSGEVNYSKGNLLKASTDFDQALKLFAEVGDRSGEARVHLYNGYIAGSLGEAETAVAEISQAMSLFKDVRNKSGEASCLTALGLSHSLVRDEEEAIRLHREAGEIFRVIGDRQNEAITLNGLGQAYEFLSEYPIALENYQHSLNLSLEMGDLDFAAVAAFKVARTYRSMGSVKRALDEYQRCLRLSRAAGKRRTEANALNDVALIYVSQQSREKTISQYQKILKFYGEISDRHGQATALNNLGDFLLRLGSKREALDSYKRALTFSEPAGDKAVLISTLYGLAHVERDLGAFESALTYIQRSINAIEDMRTKVTSPGFRMSYFAAVRKDYDLYIDILMQLDHQRPGEGFAAKALMASESARARSLLDVLTEAHADIRRGVSPELIERERHVKALIRSQAQYQMELSFSSDDSGETGQVEREINQLETEYLQIEADLRNQNQRFLSLSQAAPLTLDQMRAELGDSETLLLEYALGDERSYLWAVTADSLKTYELPSRAVLEAAGREVHDLLVAREQLSHELNGDYAEKVEEADRSYLAKAANLSQLLLGDIADQLGTKRLVIVTEGMLQYVPFDALPTPSRETRATVGTSSISSWPTNPLIATHEIIVLPSISSLAAIRAGKLRVTSSDRLVAVLADPVFSNNDDRMKNSEQHGPILLAGSEQISTQPALRDLKLRSENGSATRLVHAAEEADAILAAAPRGTVMLAKDFDANREKAMSSQIGEYQIVHFATHGFFNTDHPEFSGVVLSMVNRDGTKTNGFLPLEDVYNLNLSAELVVLSACDTALGKSVQGEGVVGLTRGFMYAGARSVVTSLWKVDDRATAALMKEFYKSMLQDCMTPASALRVAKLKIREEKAWSAPYFWAGFVLQGEYKDHIEVRRNSQFRTFLPASIAVVLISIMLFILHKARQTQS